ncbi:MAG: putative transrane protein [Ramlibacter sp.]|nr:putative transrane protein [Ramlibacter sp.]
MKRRLLLASGWTALLAASFAPVAVAAASQPSYTVSAELLQLAVGRRFPLRYTVSGFLQLTVREPVLRLLPDANRVAAEMALVAAGPALARTSAGEFDVDFALRYERSDQTLRTHQLRIRSLRVSGLPPPYPELLDAFGQALAQQTFGEVVLHRLEARDLRLAEVMGLEPDTVTVTERGLVIGFGPRRAQ